ncbi:hypothetical protein KBD75_03280 [Candidatus Woesebacteria bacterium]|nr:hypothetical protein [Candidatus Woesebacteria bacterium]
MQEMIQLPIYINDEKVVTLVDVPGQVVAILLALHEPPYSIEELAKYNLELSKIAEAHKK